MSRRNSIASLTVWLVVVVALLCGRGAECSINSSVDNNNNNNQTTTGDEKSQERVNVAITFTNVASNDNLQEKFRLCVSSLLRNARVNINFYIIGDAYSQNLAKQIFARTKNYQIDYKIIAINADELARKMHDLVAQMQSHFSYSPSSYYGDSLFFLSIGLFKVFEPSVERIILLDADLKFRADIGELNAHFASFNATNVIGIARDAQPVYRHLLWKYRGENVGTRVGSPPPDGLPGFNSGVLLLDLAKMRASSLYDELIKPATVDRLAAKYYFKGHLGDQDFFTLIGMEHEELFHVLPCTWNRQLCQWWRTHGYADIFDAYYKCDGAVNIYHGNCNTPIPLDDDDEAIDAAQLGHIQPSPPSASFHSVKEDL